MKAKTARRIMRKEEKAIAMHNAKIEPLPNWKRKQIAKAISVLVR